ncbi:cytochrome b [Pseudoxanthobacter sp.]|uniref:cytochrome b n=1 Tax=Pseudoxanthobacter sp. TaxID=1925742 RepID=UPI002FDF51E2
MPSSASSVPSRYNAGLIVLHWLIALAIALAYGLTFLWEDVAPETRTTLRQLHMGLGATVLVLMIARIAIRLAAPAPADINQGKPLQRIAAHAVHGLLYLLAVLVPALGITFVQARGRGVSLYGLVTLPPVLENPVAPAISGALKEGHELLGNVLIALALFHIAAALYHQFIVRDGILARMSLRG